MKQKGQTQLGNVSEFYKMGTTCIDAVFNLTEVLHVCVCVCVGGGGGGQLHSALDLYCTVFGSNRVRTLLSFTTFHDFP